MTHLCASTLPVSSPPLPRPSLVPPYRRRRRRRRRRLERLMPYNSILQCHRTIRLELSLSGSVGPFASFMIALDAV